MAHYAQSFVAKYGLSVTAAEDSVTNANYYPLFGTQAVGVLAIKASSTKLSFNPSLGLLSATSFAGSGAGLTGLNVGAAASGVLPVARGGSGTGTATGSGDNVLATSPNLNSPTIINGNSTGNHTFAALTVAGTATLNSILNVASGLMEMGSTTAGNTPFIDFHSSGVNIDYDSRIIANGGNSTIGNGALVYTANGGHTFNGAIYSTGDITAFSDRRLKDDITQLTGSLERVLSWRGVSYRFLINNKIARGVIAQEVEATAPEYVSVHPDTGMLTVAYEKMAADFIEAFRDVKNELDALRAEIKTLKGL